MRKIFIAHFILVLVLAGAVTSAESPGDNLVGNAEPNELEQEKAESIEHQPVAQFVSEHMLRRNTFDIGPEIYSFNYEEPGAMEQEGTFYGLRLGFTSRGWVPPSSEEPLPGGGLMFRGEARFAYGQVDYDGFVQDLQTGQRTPLKINNIDDFAIESRLLLGADLLGDNMLNTLYAGIGYRYLYDDSSSHPAGYLRESNYLYVPLGYWLDGSLQAGWSWGLGAEYDVFILGIQRSHLSDIGLVDVDNHQKSGYGYRASVNLQCKSSETIFVIEPYFRYWNIDKSETEQFLGAVFWEPANETEEYGIQFFWLF